jgi:hypothetical protein
MPRPGGRTPTSGPSQSTGLCGEAGGGRIVEADDSEILGSPYGVRARRTRSAKRCAGAAAASSACPEREPSGFAARKKRSTKASRLRSGASRMGASASTLVGAAMNERGMSGSKRRPADYKSAASINQNKMTAQREHGIE